MKLAGWVVLIVMVWIALTLALTPKHVHIPTTYPA